MENNNYNVVTRVEQEDANAAAGEPLAVKATAYSMPGVSVDGGDPVAVYETVGEAVERARSGGGPTLVESLVYRLSAHGNLIAPPGVPLHYPEHEAITVFGNTEEYEAALRGDPVPRFRARLVTDGTLSAEQADAIAGEVRDEMQEAVTFGLESPFPAAGRGHQVRLRLRRRRTTWHTSFPTSPPSRRRSARRWRATSRCSTSARTSPPPRTTRSCRPSAATASGSPRSPRPPRSAWRSAPRSPATGRSSSSTWPSSCSSRWTRWSTRRRASTTCPAAR